jgi:hypothetical protein
MTHIVRQGDVFRSTTFHDTTFHDKECYIFARINLNHLGLVSLSGNRFTDNNLAECYKRPIDELNKATSEVWEFVGRFDSE